MNTILTVAMILSLGMALAYIIGLVFEGF